MVGHGLAQIKGAEGSKIGVTPPVSRSEGWIHLEC